MLKGNKRKQWQNKKVKFFGSSKPTHSATSWYIAQQTATAATYICSYKLTKMVTRVRQPGQDSPSKLKFYF